MELEVESSCGGFVEGREVEWREGKWMGSEASVGKVEKCLRLVEKNGRKWRKVEGRGVGF